MVTKGLNDLQYEKLNNLVILLDETSTPNVTYVGKANIGALTSNPQWQILKIDESANLELKWASSTDTFSQIWDNRTTLTYS